MEQGSSKSLFVMIAVVIFGIFLSLSYWMFAGEFKTILEDVFQNTSTKTMNKIDTALMPKLVAPANKDNKTTWLWDTIDITTKSDEIITFMSSKGVSVVYLQINYSINESEYRTFISKANAVGIEVHALDGAPTWVLDDSNIQYQTRFFDWVGNYQLGATSTEKFTGMHLDVEPQGLDEWATKQNEYIENYQDFVIYAAAQSHAIGLEVALDIPLWFDTLNYNTSYGTGGLYDWLLTSGVDEMAIMAFRDIGVGVVADGTEGIYDVAKYELDKAQAVGMKVSLGVETQQIPSSPEWITFYEEGEAYMNAELDKASVLTHGYSVFDGYAIHYVDSWMNMFN